jgi:hypothetical protein
VRAIEKLGLVRLDELGSNTAQYQRNQQDIDFTLTWGATLYHQGVASPHPPTLMYGNCNNQKMFWQQSFGSVLLSLESQSVHYKTVLGFRQEL